MTQNAFSIFTEWAKGRTFNEILGCAKLHIDGLNLHYDVDEFNNNEIACAFYYYPNADYGANPVYIKAEYLPDGHILFTDLNEQKEHEKAVEYLRSNIYTQLGLKEVQSNDNEIVSYWNDYICDRGGEYDYKLHDMDEENLGIAFDCYASNEIAKMVLQIGTNFSVNNKYFYITNDYQLCTTNDIWEVINEVELHDYIVENVRIKKYGKIWDRSLHHEKEKEEVLVCKMDNGDEIWVNTEKRYFALYLTDTNKPTYLYIYG